MLPAEHHGDGFHYVVTYRRRASLTSPTQSVIVSDWRQSAHVVNAQLMYDEYDISVLAKNDAGEAPSPTRMIGYSGEDGQCPHALNSLDFSSYLSEFTVWHMILY